MQNSFIPNILKEKFILFGRYIKIIAYFFISIFLFLSLISFDINDDSFLSESSMPSNNIFGDAGSYISSFIIYTYGIMGYFIVIFFIIYALTTFFNKELRYLFIRLFIFLIGSFTFVIVSVDLIIPFNFFGLFLLRIVSSLN